MTSIALAQQVVRANDAQAARAVQMHQHSPCPAMHEADAEAISFDEAFTERHDQISRMRGRTLRPNSSRALQHIAPVSPVPGSVSEMSITHGTDLLATFADLIHHPVKEMYRRRS